MIDEGICYTFKDEHVEPITCPRCLRLLAHVSGEAQLLPAISPTPADLSPEPAPEKENPFYQGKARF